MAQQKDVNMNYRHKIIFIILIIGNLILSYTLNKTVELNQEWSRIHNINLENFKNSLGEINHEIDDTNKLIEETNKNSDEMYWSGVLDTCINSFVRSGIPRDISYSRCLYFVNEIKSGVSEFNLTPHNKIPTIPKRQLPSKKGKQSA